jgi:hypothetical protein
VFLVQNESFNTKHQTEAFMTTNFISRFSPQIAALLCTLVIGLAASSAFGQNKVDLKDRNRSFCSQENSGSDNGRVASRYLRETTVAATGDLNVDGDRNGGIRVSGEDRHDILIRACVQASGDTEAAAKTNAAGVRINTSGTIKANNTPGDGNWSVSYDIRVPRNSNLNLTAHNGGISISGVDGNLVFQTTNGGVSLSNVAGWVKGRTVNGGINVKLDGTTWKGTGMDVSTSNGGVHIEMPETYAARIETSTVNGGLKSSIPALNVSTEDVRSDDGSGHSRPTRISTAINGGGPTIRLTTTNGGVKISSPE